MTTTYQEWQTSRLKSLQLLLDHPQKRYYIGNNWYSLQTESIFISKNIIFLGLNMFLVPINIPTFRFSPFKIFLQLLLPIKFSITTLVPIFK